MDHIRDFFYYNDSSNLHEGRGRRVLARVHDVDMIESFNQKCEQKLKLSDEPAILDNGIEIQRVEKTDDLVTDLGLQQCINIILGTSASRFSHILASRNSANVPPTVSDTALGISSGGPYVFPLATYGWIESKGMKMFFATIVPQSPASPTMSTINEMAVYNGSSMGNAMLNHVQGSQYTVYVWYEEKQ